MLPAFLVGVTWIPPLLGLGALVRHRGDPALRPGLAGLLGLCVAGVLATALNFFLPVSPWAAAGLWLGGAASFALQFRWLCEGLHGREVVASLALLATLCALIASPHPVFQYDTGFYHLQVMKWLAEHAAYAGLANVHYRLGFNSLWLPTANALEHPLAAGKSMWFLNQLPILFATQLVMVGAKRLLAGDRSFPNLMLAMGAIPAASATFGIGGLYVDYTAGMVAYLAIVQWARAWESPDFQDEALPAALLTLFATLLRISLSVLALASIAALVTRRGVIHRKSWMRLGLLALAALVPWLARSAMLSGCVVFPVVATCIPALAWTVPSEKTRLAAAWIRSWARKPGPLHEGGWDWIGDWTARTLRDYPELWLVLGAMGAGAIACAIIAHRPSRSLAGVLSSSLLCTVWWFMAAPDPRFGLGPLFALGFAPAAFALSRLGSLDHARWRVATVVAVLGMALWLGYTLRAERPGTVRGLPRKGAPLLEWPRIPRVLTEIRTTRSGLQVVVPLFGDSCWAAPIPCTPAEEFDPSLRFDGYFTVMR